VRTVLRLTVIALVFLAGCAPTVTVEDTGANLYEFTLEPVPREQRWIIAVPSFTVGTGAVRIGSVDLSREGEQFYRELGSGVADIFVAEAYESQQFRITERAEIDKILYEQDLAQSGRINPDTAAAIGRIEGAELMVLGSVSEFGVQTTGGGGRVLGVFGGSSETVSARVAVEIRIVDTNTAEILAIGRGVSEVSQRNVSIDLANVMTDLRVGRTGTTIVDYAVRNAIRSAIENAARALPPKPDLSGK
jgi:curli biogenesis system outer membrane secretion channel CsgG